MFLLILVFLVSEGCGSRKETHTAGSTEEPQQEQAGGQGPEDAASTVSWTGLGQTGSMDLSYAECFSVDYFGDEYSLIRIEDSGSFLLVEENSPVPADLPEDIVVLRKPLDHIYDASSSTLDFFRELDSLSSVAMTSTEAEDWAIPEIRELVASDQITYVGKYRAPDYEYILDEDCDLAIENTMIYHKPEVKEKLEELGIPVLVERSSYEPHPLGRLEWIRFYGLLTGNRDGLQRGNGRGRAVILELDGDAFDTALSGSTAYRKGHGSGFTGPERLRIGGNIRSNRIRAFTGAESQFDGDDGLAARGNRHRIITIKADGRPGRIILRAV